MRNHRYCIHIASFLHTNFFKDDEITFHCTEEEREKVHAAVLLINDLISKEKIRIKRFERDETILRKYKEIKEFINEPLKIKKILEELYDTND